LYVIVNSRNTFKSRNSSTKSTQTGRLIFRVCANFLKKTVTLKTIADFKDGFTPCISEEECTCKERKDRESRVEYDRVLSVINYSSR